MAARSAISVGFPGANYVVELGQRESALPGEYIVEGGQAVVVVTTGQIDDLTLSATAAVTVVAAASPTIGNLTLAAVGNIAVTATLTKTIDPITLAATGEVIVSAAVDATIDPITAAATGHVASTGDVAVPWWWSQYVARHQAERAARRREELAVIGDGIATIPMCFGKGRVQHLQPVEASAAGAIPGFLGAAELDHAQYRSVRYYLHILPEGPDGEDDEEVLDLVEALIEAA